MAHIDLILKASRLRGRFAEVGKTISKATAAKIRKAMQELMDLVGDDMGESLSEAERTWREREQLLRKALREKMAHGMEYAPWCYIEAVFDETFIYCMDDTYYQASYMIAEDGAVTIGEPVEVIPHMTYDLAPSKPGGMTERRAALIGDAVALCEAGSGGVRYTGNQLEEASRAQVKLISPGWGTSGYYSAELLKRDGPAAWPTGTHMYWNHATQEERAARPEGDLSKLASVIESDPVWMAAGPSGPGLYASVEIKSAYQEHVADLAKDIGISIYASGERVFGKAEGRDGWIVTALDAREANPFNSVDYVTLPGRGGEIVQLFEAAGRAPASSSSENRNREEHTDMDEARVKAMIAEAVGPVASKLDAAQTENARLREQLILTHARTFVERRLKTIEMPEATRQRLAESLPARATLKDGALDEVALTAIVDAAATAEVKYVESFLPKGVRGLGSPAPAADEPKPEVIDAHLAKALTALGDLTEAGAKRALAGRAA